MGRSTSREFHSGRWVVAVLALTAGCAGPMAATPPETPGRTRLGPRTPSRAPAPGPALAADPSPTAAQARPMGPWSVNASAGFTVSPETLLVSGEALYDIGAGVTGRADPSTGEAFGGSFAVGGLVQLGVSGDEVLFGPAGVVRFTLDLADLPKLRPFAEAGAGILIDQRVRDRGRRKDKRVTNLNGLFLAGGGVDWMVTDTIGVGGKGYLNVAPGPGEDFFLSFLGGVTFHF